MLTSSALVLALAAGMFTIRMHNWPVEIRRPLLFTLLDCAAWLVLLWIGMMLVGTIFSVVMWMQMAPAGIPLLSADQTPRVVGVVVLGVLGTIGAVLVQRYAYRQLQLTMGRCSKCEYCLFGLTSPRCPECGTPFDPSKISHIDAGAL